MPDQIFEFHLKHSNFMRGVIKDVNGVFEASLSAITPIANPLPLVPLLPLHAQGVNSAFDAFEELVKAVQNRTQDDLCLVFDTAPAALISVLEQKNILNCHYLLREIPVQPYP